MLESGTTIRSAANKGHHQRDHQPFLSTDWQFSTCTQKKSIGVRTGPMAVRGQCFLSLTVGTRMSLFSAGVTRGMDLRHARHTGRQSPDQPQPRPCRGPPWTAGRTTSTRWPGPSHRFASPLEALGRPPAVVGVTGAEPQPARTHRRVHHCASPPHCA